MTPAHRWRAGRNAKWFDKPFGRLTAMSSVEWLTTLSEVEGQIQNSHAQTQHSSSISSLMSVFLSFGFGSFEIASACPGAT
jgi:hypothetical protein